MPAPSDPAGHLRVGTPDELAGWSRRSHLSDGRCVAWTGPDQDRVAVDAELDRTVPPALARRHGAAGFWRRWTRAECVAKLTDTPIAVLTRDGLEVDHDGELVTLRLAGDVVVSVGWSARPPR